MEMKRNFEHYKDLNKIICNAKSVPRLINIYHTRFSDLNSVNVEVFTILAEQTRHFNCQDIANILWAFATLNIINIELFDILAEQIKHKIKHFSSQDIANILWAFATLNIINVELFNILVRD